MFGVFSRLCPCVVDRMNKPVNYGKKAPVALEEAVAYALQIAEFELDFVARHAGHLPHPRILELGPGYDFGAQIILADSGAEVTVADRFLSPWNCRYHAQFYRQLRMAWGKPCAALDAVIAANNPQAAISTIAEPAETLHSLLDHGFDVVFSTAVLEHVYDLAAVVRELARVTAPGGVHSHQIDFRDHRDFSRPLEFLLMDDQQFDKLFASRHGDIGNRWRYSEVLALFKNAGFQIEDAKTTDTAASSYYAEFFPRLRACGPRRFINLDESDLRILGARISCSLPLI